jgi:hypothetical protein
MTFTLITIVSCDILGLEKSYQGTWFGCTFSMAINMLQ